MSRSVALVLAVLVAIAAVAVVTASAEPIGNQVRISQAGPTRNAGFDATNSAIAYNSRTNQYLVVWAAD